MPKESLHLIERCRNNSIFDQKISLSAKISHKFLFADSQILNSGPSNLLGFKGRIFQFESTVREKFKIFGRIFIPGKIMANHEANVELNFLQFDSKRSIAKISAKNSVRPKVF